MKTSKGMVVMTITIVMWAGFSWAGSLTPPGPPGPTMKTLQQVEPRTPISSAPFTINQPGSYYLTTNLAVSSGTAITISTNGVTLDLNGYTIRSTANPAGGTAILIGSGLRNLTILNGNIEGEVTNYQGSYSGSGFGYGICYYVGTAPRGSVRVSGVNVSGCLYDGINVGNGDSTVVESCAVRTVGNDGIVASVVKNCTALECGGTAISGKTVSDCLGESTGSNHGYGVFANTALNCFGYSSNGIGVFANTAQNCYGTSRNGHGVYAYASAQNSYGYSSSGDGLHAYRTAIGCYGESSSGPAGLSAQNAAFCIDYHSGSGTAIQGTVATGCYAAAGTNNITYKYNMPP